MASAEMSFSTVEHWKTKTCQFTNRSNDALASIFSRTLEAIPAILKNSEPSHVQRSLKSIEFELSNCKQVGNSDELPFRTLMHGIIECFHLILIYFTSQRNDAYEKAVSTIEEWKKKGVDFASGSSDPLASVISRGFDAMLLIIKNSEQSHIRRALRSLDFEISQSIQDDNIKELSIRSLMYGMMETIQLTLQHLIEKKNQHTLSDEAAIEQNEIPIPINLPESSEINSTDPVDQLPTDASIAIVVDLQEKLSKSEEREKKAINIAGQNLSRAEYLEGRVKVLESLIDKEPEFADQWKKEKEELQKKLEELHEQLEKEKKAREEGEENHKRIVEDLSDQLHMEKKTREAGEELHTAYKARLEELSEQLKKEKKRREEGEESHKTKEAEFLQSFNTMDKANKLMEKNLKVSENYNKELRRRLIEMEKLKEQNTQKLKGEERDDREEAKKVVPQKRRASSNGESNSKTMKMDNEDTNISGKKKKMLKCLDCDFECVSVSSYVKHLRDTHATTAMQSGHLIRCDCGHESHSDAHSRQCPVSNFTVIRRLKDEDAEKKNDKKCNGVDFSLHKKDDN